MVNDSLDFNGPVVISIIFIIAFVATFIFRNKSPEYKGIWALKYTRKHRNVQPFTMLSNEYVDAETRMP
jgi:hypothetical protein